MEKQLVKKLMHAIRLPKKISKGVYDSDSESLTTIDRVRELLAIMFGINLYSKSSKKQSDADADDMMAKYLRQASTDIVEPDSAAMSETNREEGSCYTKTGRTLAKTESQKESEREGEDETPR